jgi:hypothetical protein
MRKKYAIRAANLEAQLENELVDELRTEIERLGRELDEANAQIEYQVRERNSLVLARSNDLSNAAIERATQAIEDRQREHDDEKLQIAHRFVDWLKPLFEWIVTVEFADNANDIFGSYLNYFITTVLPLLIEDEETRRSWLSERIIQVDKDENTNVGYELMSNRGLEHQRKFGLEACQQRRNLRYEEAYLLASTAVNENRYMTQREDLAWKKTMNEVAGLDALIEKMSGKWGKWQ